MKKGVNKSAAKNLTAFTFIMCLIVIGGMAVYYQYMKRQQMRETVQTPATETEKLLAKDMEIGYPETPTEVMKLWGRMNQCLYNSALSEEEYKKMVKQFRMMYSTELLAQNEEAEHLAKLKAEIESLKKDKGKIVSYSAETGKSVQYKTIDGKECAYIRISYFVNRNNEYYKTFQDYILVKEENKWKILGFQAAKSETATKEEVTKS